MLELEFDEPLFFTCECCGGRTTRLTRFVSRDGSAYAVYYASFSDKHSDRTAKVIVSIGGWGGWEGDEPPPDRAAFAMEIRSGAENYEVMVTSAADSPWADSKILGVMLDRDQALAHPWIKEAFHVTDHIVLEDQPLKQYLNPGGDDVK